MKTRTASLPPTDERLAVSDRLVVSAQGQDLKEEMAGIVSSALKTLDCAVNDSPGFSLFRSKHKVKQWLKDLETTYVMVVGMERTHISQEMTELAFNMERAITEFAYTAAKSSSCRNSTLVTLAHVLVDMTRSDSDQVQLVDACVSSLFGKVKRLMVLTPAYLSDPLIGSNYRDDRFLVGVEADIDEVVARLTDSSGTAVIVRGASGLGKMPFARKVCEHRKVRDRFKGFAWVDAKGTQARDIWERVLVELCPDDWDRRKFLEMGKDMVFRAATEMLKCRECLVVLVGVRQINVWGHTINFVQKIGMRSRILVTTSHVGLIDEKILSIYNLPLLSIYDLPLLNVHQSWDLFQKRVSFNNDDTEMTKLGKEMVKYCGGLPLAIVVLGGLLEATKFKSVDEWEKVCDSLKRHKERVPDESGLSLVLNFSFDEMPITVKECLFHLTLFPENHKIRAKELCRIWIAEGLIDPSESAESDAYGCLSELVRRCMVQVRRWGSSGRVKTFHVHVLIREFCFSKARCARPVRVVDFRGARQKDPAVSLSPKACPTLAVYMEDANHRVGRELYPLVREKDDSLKSLMCFSPAPFANYEVVLEPLLENFCKLRVLKLENLYHGYIGVLPKEIKNLVLLKFLSLKNCHVLQLPSSIRRLQCLQTLDLRSRFGSELPVSISKLTALRHLYLSRHSTLKGRKLSFENLNRKLGFENLSNLRTLVNISTKLCNVKDLTRLKKLVKMKLQVHDVVDFEKISWHKFDHLESLAVENCTESRMDIEPLINIRPQLLKLQIEGMIKNLPERVILGFHSNLTKLHLKGTILMDNIMNIFGKMEKLVTLILDSESFEGAQMVCSAGSFPRLESLSLVGLDNLRDWIVEEDAMNKLSYLHINHCSNLWCYRMRIPDGLLNSATLKDVVLEKMPSWINKDFAAANIPHHVSAIPLL